jgi:hypothetical protein
VTAIQGFFGGRHDWAGPSRFFQRLSRLGAQPSTDLVPGEGLTNANGKDFSVLMARRGFGRIVNKLLL